MRRGSVQAGAPTPSMTSEEDVRQAIQRIKDSPFTPCKDSIRGFIYEVETGNLRKVD
jgi:carbonic anhydrase